MAASALTVQVVTTAGLADALAAANVDGNYFANTGREWLEVNNAGVGSVDVTVTTPATVDGEPIADRTVAVASGARKKIGPFSPTVFNDANARVNVTYTGVTSVTVGVFKLA